MNPKSASTLVWLAVILIFLGFVGLNPALSLFLFALAAISAAIPAIWARQRLRIAGIIVFFVVIVLGVNSYPTYKKHMDQYKDHVENTQPQHPEQRW